MQVVLRPCKAAVIIAVTVISSTLRKTVRTKFEKWQGSIKVSQVEEKEYIILLGSALWFENDWAPALRRGS